MSWSTLLRWSVREIRNNLSFSIFFLFNLSVGLIGFLCLDAFKTSLDASLQENSKSFLSADFAVGARRQLKDSEVAWARAALPPGTLEGRTCELFSMVASGDGSRLVQIKAIDDSYPFYGRLILDSGLQVESGAPKDLQTNTVAWVYPEVLTQLNIKLGDDIKLGDQKFRITAVVTEDGSQSFRLASLAPKIFVGMNQLEKTHLIRYGTTLTDTLLFKTTNTVDTSEIVENLKLKIEDSAVQIQNYQAAAGDSGRALKYLSDYLGLVSLVALFLAALGSGYLFRSYLFSRLYQIAIFNSLGLQKRQAQNIYLMQLVLLGLAASLLSLLGAYACLPILTKALQGFSSVDIAVFLPLKTMILSLVMGVLGSLVVGLPFLRPAQRVQTARLLLEYGEVGAATSFQRRDILLFLPGTLLYWGLGVWQAKSLVLGGQFVLIFFGALLSLWACGWILLKLIGMVSIKTGWTLRQALLSLGRRRGANISAIVALGLGTLLMNLMPQLKVSLRQDLTAPQDLKLPSLFLFDIQEEQVDPLQTFLAKRNLQLQQLSPLVRARIIKVNGKAFERQQEGEENFRSREDEAQARFRNRGVNLSYREHLTDSETLKAGHEFSGRYRPEAQRPAELSVETHFADQVGFALGDLVTFEVQGVEVEGQVVNLRSVKWNSFQPNFFIQIQPGVLDQAPKTFLASISSIPQDQLGLIQNQLVQNFSNISIVDVHRVIQRIIEISDRMSWSLELMAALSLIAGFIVLFSIANYEVQKRRWDINLMKIFGARRSHLLQYLIFEFGLLGFLSALFGVLLSLLVSYLISTLFFEGTYQFDLFWPLLSLFMVSVLAILIVVFVSYRIVQRKPVELLQQRN